MVSVESDIKPKISGGPLNGAYEFAQLHFHWGENDTIGSEDLIDGQRLNINSRHSAICCMLLLLINEYRFEFLFILASPWNCIWYFIKNNIVIFVQPWKIQMD